MNEKDLLRSLPLVLLAMSALLFIFGLHPSLDIFPTKEEVEAMKNPPKPYATPFEPQETFSTVSMVTPVENSTTWYVFVERKSNGTRVPAKVEPFRQIVVGTSVKLSLMHWEMNSAQKLGPKCSNYPFVVN